MKPPTKLEMVSWVKQAWDSLSPEMIQKSFRVCGITNPDGSQDEEIGVGGIAFECKEELARTNFLCRMVVI